jgi:hypothetical protein
MRVLKLAVLGTAVTLGGAAAQGHDHDPDAAVAGGGHIVEGWMVRTDRNEPLDNVNFRMEGADYRVTVGPAVVLYREGDRSSGQYEVSGTFTQMSSLGHAHSYGLILGGSDLQGAGQAYTYFVVRGDGVYLLKKRDGDNLTVLTQGGDRAGYVAHEAIHSENSEGVGTNELAIRVGANDVQFLVNGTVVITTPKSQVHTDGIAGVRINHNLDIRIESFTLER